MPVRKESKFLPEAWTRVGEFHFDNPNELQARDRRLPQGPRPSRTRPTTTARSTSSPGRTTATTASPRRCASSTTWSSTPTRARRPGRRSAPTSGPRRSSTSGVSFAEPDWDGDTLPDPINGPAARDRVLQGAREGEARARGLPAPRRHLLRPDEVRRTRSPSTRRCSPSGRTTRTRRGCRTGSSTPTRRTETWSPPPRSASSSAASTPRGATGTSTTRTTRRRWRSRSSWPRTRCSRRPPTSTPRAQACKTKWQENQKDTKKLEECKKLYATAAELYEKYLAAYPNSKRGLRVLGLLRRRALLLGPAASRRSTPTRTSATRMLDNRYQEDAAFRMIKALRRDHRRHEEARSRSRIRRSPTRRTPSRRSSPLPMPDIYKKYLDAIDWYVEHIKNDRVPDLKYAAAVIALRYRDWPDARERLGADHRAVLRRPSRTSASRPTTRSCRPTSSTTTSRTKSRRTARSASC